GGVVRRLAGGTPAPAYASCALPLRRRIESQIGRLDHVRVRIVGGTAEPLGSAKGSGAAVLTSTTVADGFVLVPPERLRIEDGESVSVYQYGSIHESMQKGDDSRSTAFDAPLPPSDLVAQCLALLQPLETEAVSLPGAAGRVLGEDVVAPVDVPGFDRS